MAQTILIVEDNEAVRSAIRRALTARGHEIIEAETAEKALAIHRRLCGVYHCPIPYFHDLDPVSELISSLLSHRTRNADSGRAFKALRARFRDYLASLSRGTPVAVST